ncbi:MAG: hypothetical protein HY782_10605 [Chloroflexi bacterium]|nr:hypothetical protein [Chloroflexota bacterium]
MLEWARAFYATLYLPLRLPYIAFLEPYQNILPNLLVAHLGLLATLLAVRALAFLTPRISLLDTGLAMDTELGRRFIPYAAMRGIRSVELEPNGRFVVWVHSTKGLPLQGWLGSLLFGRVLWRGFLLTSDLAGFDGVVGTIIAELKRKHGEEGFGARFSEESPTWLLTTLNAPKAAMRSLATAEEIQITPRDAARQMTGIALALAVPLAIGGLVHLQFPWGLLIVPILAMIEWPLVALYLGAIPIGELQRMNFDEAIRIYPRTQVLRWLPALGFALLVAAGAPLFLLVAATIPAVALGCYTVYALVQEWFAVKFPDTLIGILVTLIYQIVLYEVFIALLPR